MSKLGRIVLLVAALWGVVALPSSDASEPTSGTVDATSPQVTWSGGPLVFTTFGTGCDPATPQCDRFDLTIGTLPVDAPDVVISGSAGSGGDVLSLYVYGPDGSLAGEDTALTANPRGDAARSCSRHLHGLGRGAARHRRAGVV